MTNELWALLVLLAGLAYFIGATPAQPPGKAGERRLYSVLIIALIVGVLIAIGEQVLR